MPPFQREQSDSGLFYIFILCIRSPLFKNKTKLPHHLNKHENTFLITEYFENYLMGFRRRLNMAASAGRRVGKEKIAIIITSPKH